MDKLRIIWIDLRLSPRLPGLCEGIPGTYEPFRVGSIDAIQGAIRENQPGFLCFEYDSPAPAHLDALRSARSIHPLLPILMITEDHSEELAVWALRMRVWDYMVAPVSMDDLCLRFAAFSQAAQASQARNWPGIAAASSWSLPGQIGERPPADRECRFRPAISFVDENLTEKISLGRVAQISGLGPFQFSRAFKQEQGTTFREFLIQRRINRALQLFNDPQASVTDVAFAVGFNDLSYFARMFRRFTGVSPSLYRKERELRDTFRFPLAEPVRNTRPGWPIAKYSYPTARKS
jgi:two-component system response regulator YesN